MADVLLSLEEVSKQLQLSKDQIVELVKKGVLRGLRDQKTFKFKPADVDAFKKKLASGATTLSEGPDLPAAGASKKSAASKIDLTEVEVDSAIDDTDQTSVLAPVEPGEPKPKPEEAPTFQFGDKDLALDEEKPAVIDEGDQTSMLMPGEEKPKEGAPESQTALDFGDKDIKLPTGEEDKEDEAGESVLVADESESSMDILEVAEESSSESASSASGMVFSDEVSSGEEIETAPSESAINVAPAGAAKSGKRPGAGEPTTDKVVTDILGPAAEDSDEALETLDVDEVVETKETGLKEFADIKPETAATVPVGDEYETVGLPGAEETKTVIGETPSTAGEAPTTGTVDGAVAEALQEAAGAEEPSEEAEEAAPAFVPAGWETAQSWPVGNGLLIAATVVLIVGGAFFICDLAAQRDSGFHSGITDKVVNIVKGVSFLR